MKQAVKIFCSYSHKDEELKNELENHLSILRRIGLIKVWTDRKILPGEYWQKRINGEIEKSDLILLLISSDFIASDYCFDVEVKKAIEKHEQNESMVVPILVRDCDWEGAPFEHIQGLPTDMKPIISKHWHSKDEGFRNVTSSLKKTIKIIIENKKEEQINEFNNLPPSIEAHRQFITKYIEGELVNKAKQKILELDEDNSWKLAVKRNLVKDYKDYLYKYPNSKYSQEAKKQIKQIKEVKEKVIYQADEKLIALIDKIDSQEIRNQLLKHINIVNKKYRVNKFSPHLNLVFSGNPGTGKTTVARLYAEILKESGILKSSHLVEVMRHNLVGQYVGQTAQKVTSVFREAIGGVLFIDEAYTLSIGSQDSFGQEAVDTLLKLMEDYRGEVCVIFAGYPREIETFLNVNTGIKSRIAQIINFGKVHWEILFEVFKKKIKSQGLTYTEQFIERISQIIKKEWNYKDENFGNFRFVELLIQDVVISFAERCDNNNLDLNEAELELIDIPEKFKN